MNKEIEISPRQIASAITNLLNEKEKLEQENKELHNNINELEDELNWYKQECDDLEMRIGLDE